MKKTVCEFGCKIHLFVDSMNSETTVYSDDSILGQAVESTCYSAHTESGKNIAEIGKVSSDVSKFVTWAARLELEFLTLRNEIRSGLPLKSIGAISSKTGQEREINASELATNGKSLRLEEKIDGLIATSTSISSNGTKSIKQECNKLTRLINSKMHSEKMDELIANQKLLQQDMADLNSQILDIKYTVNALFSRCAEMNQSRVAYIDEIASIPHITSQSVVQTKPVEDGFASKANRLLHSFKSAEKLHNADATNKETTTQKRRRIL